MKKWFLLFLFYFLLATGNESFAQSKAADSLKNLLLKNTSQDTNRVKLLNQLSAELRGKDIPSSRSHAEEAYNLSVKLKYTGGETYALRNLGISYMTQGNFSKADEFFQKGLIAAKQWGDPRATVLILTNLGFVYSNLGEYPKSISYLEEALDLANQSSDSAGSTLVFANLGQVYYFQGNYPKALDYTLQSLKMAEQIKDRQATAQALTGVGNIYSEVGERDQALSYLKRALIANEELGSKRDISIVLNGIANVYRLQGNYSIAIEYYQRAIKLKQELKSDYGVALNESRLADIYLRQRNVPLALSYAYKSLPAIITAGDKDNVGFIYSVMARSSLLEKRIDSAIYRGRQSMEISKETGNGSGIADASQVLAEAYAEKKEYSNAYFYQQQYATYRDSVASDSVSRRVGFLLYNYNLEKKQGEIALLTKDKEIQAQANKRQREFLIGTFIGLGILSVMAVALLRSNRQKQIANTQLTQQAAEIKNQAGQLLLQNKEINIQKDNLQKAFENLKSTQSLLIQSEKMASLGQLTAGIAHEIQNPLNFVNNFSEVNKELLEELKMELEKGNANEVIALANDVMQNEEKINHHGKRADAIVKGMLQHAQTSSGQREPTDINALAEEYLKLSYHGLRAKDKSFQATMHTEWDLGIGKINIVPQDVARVLLNLYSNAFYAVAEKKKHQNGRLSADLSVEASAKAGASSKAEFEPTVSVSTKKSGDKVFISVKDNGNGVPKEDLDKIFQPFFTTKPTGQGTGLGLSLAYDIIKAYGGEIKVETKEGEGSEFIIMLPMH